MGNHAADLKEFFESDDVATFTHTGSSAVVIDAIFTDAYKAANMTTGNVEGLIPCLICKASDVTSAIPDDLFVVGGVSYYLIGAPEPDGTGLATVYLSKEKQHGTS